MIFAPEPLSRMRSSASELNTERLRRRVTMGMIPKEPTPPSTRMADYSWLFYGNVGVGKTTLANQFPSPVFIATEQGTTAMHAASIPIGNWQDMKSYWTLLTWLMPFVQPTSARPMVGQT